MTRAKLRFRRYSHTLARFTALVGGMTIYAVYIFAGSS